MEIGRWTEQHRKARQGTGDSGLDVAPSGRGAQTSRIVSLAEQNTETKKNDERSRYMYENKENTDKMSPVNSDIK
jgi:hypothetical protein